MIWREKQSGVSEDVSDQGTESDYDEPTESESSSISGREQNGECEENDVDDEDLKKNSEIGKAPEHPPESSQDVLYGLVPESPSVKSEPSVAANLVLDPLSGEHLKAVKRLAGYFRLRWTEQGNGKCRRLVLHAKSGPQATAEISAAENLISKYKKIENGVTTKRLPTARCTPQVSGTQVKNSFVRPQTVLNIDLAAGTFWRLGGLYYWLRLSNAGLNGSPNLGARCRYISRSGVHAACTERWSECGGFDAESWPRIWP